LVEGERERLGLWGKNAGWLQAGKWSGVWNAGKGRGGAGVPSVFKDTNERMGSWGDIKIQFEIVGNYVL